MGQKVAFIDESGDSGLDISNPGTSSHFVVAAVIIDAGKVENLEERIDAIAQKHCQGSELKSRKFREAVRRQALLDDLEALDYHARAIVVDKARLVQLSEGYSFHGSFYKNLHGLLDLELVKRYGSIRLVADEHDTANFMGSFQSYLERKLESQGLLWPEATIEFKNSKDSRLIQLADIIAGTVATMYDPKRDRSDDGLFPIELKRAIITSFPWLPRSLRHFNEDARRGNDFSEVVAELAYKRAVEFVEKHGRELDQGIIDQVNCVKYLLFCFQTEPERYISTYSIIDHLKAQGSSNIIDEDAFRRNIMARLRDERVIIASNSGSPGGYKIPFCLQDIYDFLNHYNTVIMPMLKRVSMLRDDVRTETDHACDVLEPTEYERMRVAIDRITRDLGF